VFVVVVVVVCFLVSSPYGPDVPRPCRQALCAHNLIAAQDSPLPLLKFQMPPRLKHLMSSGSNRREQRYAYFFSLKIPSNWTPSRFPSRVPYGKSCPFTGPFYIYLRFLIKIPLNKEIFFPSLRDPKKGAPLLVPQNQGPYGNRCPFPEPYLGYPSVSSVEEPSIQVLLIDLPQREMPHF